MQLNERQRLILMSILLDQRRLAGLPWRDVNGMPRSAVGRYRLRIQMARQGLVPVAVHNWLDRSPTASEVVLFSREYERLAGKGLLERHNRHGGRRTSHLKLTPAGRRIAEQVLAEESGLDANMDMTIDWSRMKFFPVEMPPATGGGEAASEEPEDE